MDKETPFKKYLYNEITAVVALISVVVGVMNWVNNPDNKMSSSLQLIQKDISIINSNHLTHLQTYAEEIKELKERDIKFDERLDRIDTNVATILALLSNAEIK